MNEVQRCNSCGAGLTLDQLRRTDCPYCNVAYPHHARAVEHAALVNQIMAQQTGGLYGGPSAPPVTYGVTPGPPPLPFGQGAPPPYGAGSPPPFGAPGQYAPPIYPTPYAPFNVNMLNGNPAAQVERAVARSLIVVVIAVAVVFALAVCIGAAAFLLLAR